MEQELLAAGFGPVAGVDEAGRGACCGPISIAACILPFKKTGTGYELPAELAGLNDSKKLTAKARERFYGLIKQHALSYAEVMISAEDIDRWGIQHANVSGMRRAVALLDVVPGYVLTDAVKVPGLAQPHLPVIKGDQMAACIAAASILAKVSRDHRMIEMDAEYPGYGLAGHKGYGTKAHMAAVSLHGGTPHHRYTYKNVATAHAEWLERQ